MRREDQRGGNGSVPGTHRKAVPIAMATGPAEYTAGQQELPVRLMVNALECERVCPQTLAFAPNVEHWDTHSVEKPLSIWLLPSTACKLEGGKRGSR